ncbi:MAG: drug/metabolite exporter YedA [Kofleriaceae bacterium]
MKRMIASTETPTLASPIASRWDWKLIASLTAVYVIWGSTYLAMKVAMHDLPPLLMASMRFASAGMVLLLVALHRGVAWPTARDWISVAPVGALLFLGGNGFIAIAQGTIPSGATAVCAAMMPLWMGVLAWITGEKPTSREWVSLVIGFVGILVLMGGPSLAGDPLHIVLLLLAPAAWALGSIIARRLSSPATKDVFMLSAMEMITGGIVLFVVGALRGESIPHHVGAKSWLALAYLWVAGSLIAFTAYSWLLRNTRPVIATSYAYVNPSLAVVLGAALSGEPLGITTVVANVLMVIAIWLALSKARAAAHQA